MKKTKELLWTAIAMGLAALSILAMLSQSKELTLQDLAAALGHASPFWLILSVIAMSGYIVFEALTLYYLLDGAGYRKNPGQSLTYASADIYCASITPSASGGQPVCAWFMKRDGVPMGYITAILAVYLIGHTFATLTIGIITLIGGWHVFASLSWIAIILVILGYLVMTGLAFLFIALLGMEKKIFRIGCRIIDWLTRKNLVKRSQYWKDRLDHTLSDYSAGVAVIKGKWKLMLIVYLLNIGQRLSQTIVSTLMYMATGGTAKHAGTVFSAQVFSSIGSMCAPVPGGMGIADYLLYSGLRSFMDKEAALQLELLSRSTSFYLCVAVSMVIVIIGYIRRRNFYFSYKRRFR